MPTPLPSSRGGRILVIDDEPMLRQTLGQVLTDEGYVVDFAGDGSDALARVRAARPDAILLDLMMPGMNGRQFLQALRDDAEYTNVPVLIMTAVHGLEINLAAIGASEVVEKPFDVDELLNKVALAVYRSRDAESIPPTPASAVDPVLEPERGVVLVVEHDRAKLQQLDLVLSERGYTVVTMTRALGQLTRLARALHPRAILLELTSDGVPEIVRELRATQEVKPIPLLVFSRGELPADSLFPEAIGSAIDNDLVGFVERQR